MVENHPSFWPLKDTCPKFTLIDDLRPSKSSTVRRVLPCVLFCYTHQHRKSPVLVAPLQLTNQVRVAFPLPSHLPGRERPSLTTSWKSDSRERQGKAEIKHCKQERKGLNNSDHRSEKESNIASVQAVNELQEERSSSTQKLWEKTILLPLRHFSPIFHPYKKGLETLDWQLSPG